MLFRYYWNVHKQKKMAALAELFQAQQILNNLYHTGHIIRHDQYTTLLTQLIHHTNNMVSYHYDELEFTQQQQLPKEKSKVIAKKKLDTDCPEMCVICHETPKYKDAICTDCNHYFCKPCWNSWMDADGSNQACPTCRKDMPVATSFKARKSRANVEENQTIAVLG